MKQAGKWFGAVLMRLIIAIIVMFLSALALTGQTTANSAPQRTVTKAEIERLEERASAKLEKLSYRQKTSHIYFGDDEKSPYSSHIEIYEVLLRPNRVRSVHEWKDKQGFSRRELINLGNNRVYVKNGDDPWRFFKYPPVYVIDALNPDALPQKTKLGAIYEYDYSYLGEEDLNGISADVYQASTREIYRLRDFDIVNLTVGKFWFDKKNRLLKKQFNSTDGKEQFDSSKSIPKDFGQGLIRSEQEITEYEYDIPIKIEAPIK